MPSSTPPRKFAPTPIEQTAKSSRQPAVNDKDNKKPRRFAPEPIEETVKSSKDRQQPAVSEEKPKPSRFAPEPVEHTIKSSKHAGEEPSEQDVKPKPRRFAPQVVEETHKSSKDKEGAEKKAHVKCKPEPVSTTHITNRKAKSEEVDAIGEEPWQTAPRKFKPILLDTAQRSRRAGDANTGLSQSDRTEYAYHLHATEHWKRVTGEPTAGPAQSTEPEPTEAIESDDGASESERSASTDTDHSSQVKRQASPLDGSAPRRPACLVPGRTHSFRMPDLDTIDSSESEEESNPSPMSTSPGPGGSPITAPDDSYEYFKHAGYKHATRIRESIDENFTHYLLDIERKNAQQRLEEQALAAYPNPDFGYEPPDHYINNDDDEDIEIEDRPVTWEGHDDDEDDVMDEPRRESTATISWEQKEMEKHAEELQRERNANKITAKPSQSPWWKPPELGTETGPPDAELKSMRDRARPPMLGGDIVFPRCPSPEPARFDVTQGSAALRNQMCYLNETAENERKRSGEDEGLWKVAPANNQRRSTIKSPASPNAKASSTKGLWGGFCVDDGEKDKTPGGLAPPPGPTGLMTPKSDGPNPFELAFTEGRPVGIMTPETQPTRMKDDDLRQLNAVLVSERDFDAIMEREYPDSFITQVYNYLSLGYPSIARDFDDELSKISRISISDLRQDDQKAPNDSSRLYQARVGL